MRQTSHLFFDVYVVLQVSQTSLMEPWSHLLDVAAQVFQQLFEAITSPEAQFALAGQMDGVDDVLIPTQGRERFI